MNDPATFVLRDAVKKSLLRGAGPTKTRLRVTHCTAVRIESDAGIGQDDVVVYDEDGNCIGTATISIFPSKPLVELANSYRDVKRWRHERR